MILTTAVVLLQLLVTSQSGDQALAREARTRQSRFESLRRMHLPRDRHGSSGVCDARIGRFCYTYDSEEQPAPPEAAVITAARDALLLLLDSAAAANPSDPWLVGQQVRYEI